MVGYVGSWWFDGRTECRMLFIQCFVAFELYSPRITHKPLPWNSVNFFFFTSFALFSEVMSFVIKIFNLNFEEVSEKYVICSKA